MCQKRASFYSRLILLQRKIKSAFHIYKKAFVFGIGCWNMLDRRPFHTNEQNFCGVGNGSVSYINTERAGRLSGTLISTIEKKTFWQMLENNQVSEARYIPAFLLLLHIKDNESSLVFLFLFRVQSVVKNDSRTSESSDTRKYCGRF